MDSLRIVHLFPDLLNLYGDGGNVHCLEKRCEWRGIPVETQRVHYGEEADLRAADLVFLGGGPDREQRLASEQLMNMKDELKEYVEEEGVLLAICGGYQILGAEWLLGDEVIKGLGILNMVTSAPKNQGKRLIGDVALESTLSSRPVIGYENHAGRTYLGGGIDPFGKVVSSSGYGNNDTDKHDGALYKNVLGTYLHGPLLGKNPQIADHLLKAALASHAARGGPSFDLCPLDDTVEDAAHGYMARRLGLKGS